MICCYAECRVLFMIMLHVITLNVIMQIVIKLRVIMQVVIMLSVIIQSDIILSVVAPLGTVNPTRHLQLTYHLYVLQK